MDYLVGSTGFVGTNLKIKHHFDQMFHSANIEQAFEKQPDLLVYSGVPAEMFLANKNPEKDLDIIKNAIEIIQKINAKQVVLISTIAVYQKTDGVNEDTETEWEHILPYGRNRCVLEKWVKEKIENHLIVRLPGLYGTHLKKNFIYDLIHQIPSMLKKEIFLELAKKEKEIETYYHLQENGFYQCCAKNREEKIFLKELFDRTGFSALCFTDSRGIYQYYPLKELWGHIEKALKNGITQLNLAVEPVKISELYQKLTGKQFENFLNKPVPYYNYKTKYAELFGGTNGYIYNKEYILEDIKQYVEKEWRKEWGEDAVINF